ncbi:MAG: hypothetical protein MZU97_15645 [Bacillus subtilis]|nr:hypothetical protein [Bacillus subtilis]
MVGLRTFAVLAFVNFVYLIAVRRHVRARRQRGFFALCIPSSVSGNPVFGRIVVFGQLSADHRS